MRLPSPEDALDRLRRWAAGPPEPLLERRRISIAFMITAALAVGGSVWLLITYPPGRNPEMLVIAAVALLIPLIILGYDLTRRFPEGATHPGKALAGYAQALGRGNWKLAYDFLAGPERQSPEVRTTPDFQDTPRARHAFTDAGGFGSYWGQLQVPVGDRAKSTSFKILLVQPLGPGFAAGTLRMTLHSHSTTGFGLFGVVGYLASRRAEKHELRKLLVEQAGRWFVANGEASDEIDRALIHAMQHSASPEIEL